MDISTILVASCFVRCSFINESAIVTITDSYIKDTLMIIAVIENELFQSESFMVFSITASINPKEMSLCCCNNSFNFGLDESEVVRSQI